MMLASEMKWTDTRALPKGVQVSILYGDIKKAEPLGFRIKIPAEGMLAPHTHPVIERVTVISGTAAMGHSRKFDNAALKDLPVGSIAIFPKDCPKFASAKEEHGHPGECRRSVGHQLHQPCRRSAEEVSAGPWRC